MSLLAGINGPADVKALPADELAALAAEIRDFLITSVAATGGHLGPNLGVVELSIALHRVFDSPTDILLWDTGHQAYVHKLLTGRASQFAGLRQEGGISGYPSRSESPHDVIENSHASTALSYADGIAKAFELTGQHGRAVVAVVGDGALTGGMAWEALNNIAASPRPVVIVVNDNGRSYEPTVGGFADHLAALRLLPQWESVMNAVKRTVPRTPLVGRPAYSALHGMKQGLKDLLQPQALFEDLGLKYVGPIDGHDVAAVESALRRARRFNAPVVVHCLTTKGKGFEPAENDEADCMHGIGPIDVETGRPRAGTGGVAWTDVFADEIVDIARARPDVVGISAAMVRPVGLHPLATQFPDRVFDVGIAEQHAVTSAAGMAVAGLHPVVCVYSTFLNRAFDQVLMDVALHRLPVTFVLDRAGITGDDGPSHHGMWDLSVLGVVPGIRVAAPRDATQLRELLREAIDDDQSPTVLRFPKGRADADIPAIGRMGKADVLVANLDADVLVVAAGAMASVAMQAVTVLAADGLRCMVVDPRWLLPVDPALLSLATRCPLVVTIEDNVGTGGLGDAWGRAMRGQPRRTELLALALPKAFIPHGRRESLLSRHGLAPQAIADVIRNRMRGSAAHPGGSASATQTTRMASTLR